MVLRSTSWLRKEKQELNGISITCKEAFKFKKWDYSKEEKCSGQEPEQLENMTHSKHKNEMVPAGERTKSL
jgi:hypothetical protein